MQLKKLVYVCLMCIHLKLLCVSALPRSMYLGRMNPEDTGIETSRKQYAHFQLIDKLLKRPSPESLGEALELWTVVMKAIKKLTDSLETPHVSQHDYWLLRQG